MNAASKACAGLSPATKSGTARASRRRARPTPNQALITHHHNSYHSHRRKVATSPDINQTPHGGKVFGQSDQVNFFIQFARHVHDLLSVSDIQQTFRLFRPRKGPNVPARPQSGRGQSGIVRLLGVLQVALGQSADQMAADLAPEGRPLHGRNVAGKCYGRMARRAPFRGHRSPKTMSPLSLRRCCALLPPHAGRAGHHGRCGRDPSTRAQVRAQHPQARPEGAARLTMTKWIDAFGTCH